MALNHNLVRKIRLMDTEAEDLIKYLRLSYYSDSHLPTIDYYDLKDILPQGGRWVSLVIWDLKDISDIYGKVYELMIVLAVKHYIKYPKVFDMIIEILDTMLNRASPRVGCICSHLYFKSGIKVIKPGHFIELEMHIRELVENLMV